MEFLTGDWAESLVIPDIVVADRQLLTELNVGVNDRFVIQPTENNSLLVVTVIHQHPHPLANAKLFVLDFYLDVVALRVFSHCHNLSMKP